MNQRDWRGQKANQSAFDQLLKSDEAYFWTVSRQLASLAAGMGLPPAEVERVVAEAWLKAVEHCDLFEGSAIKQRLRCWLMKVVYGKSVDALRRLSNHPCESLDTRDDELIDDRQAERAETAELREQLDMQLENVSLGNEESVYLFRARYFQGLSIKELAEQFCMTTDAVKSRIRRVREQVHELVEGST